MAKSTTAADKYDAITSLNSLTSPLLRLPAELRNAIYVYVATEGTYSLHQRPRFDSGPVERLAPTYKGNVPQWIGLITACRQLRSEAGLLPYTINAFDAGDLDHFNVLFTTLETLHKPIETLHLEVEIMQAHKWNIGSRQPSNLATVLPSVKKVVVCGVLGLGYRHRVLVDRLSLDVDEEVMRMRQIVREWLRAEDDGELEVVLLEEEMKSELSLCYSGHCT